LRAHRLYGFSPVEQIALTINIALRRDAATLDYYRSGSTLDAFATLPKEWTTDQIRSFQDYFDALISGNLAPAPAIPGVGTKREHFLDRLRRS
jgi:phage portal protein BeeE